MGRSGLLKACVACGRRMPSLGETIGQQRGHTADLGFWLADSSVFWHNRLEAFAGFLSPAWRRSSPAAFLHCMATAHWNSRGFCLLRRDSGWGGPQLGDDPGLSPQAELKSACTRCHSVWAGTGGSCPSEVPLEPRRLSGYQERSFSSYLVMLFLV